MVVQVLKMDILSKLSFSDSTKFMSIVQDVFMEVAIQVTQDDLLRTNIEACFKEMGLVKNERQVSCNYTFYYFKIILKCF